MAAVEYDFDLNESMDRLTSIAENVVGLSQSSTVSSGTPTKTSKPTAASTPASEKSSRHGVPLRSYNNSADSFGGLQMDATAEVSLDDLNDASLRSSQSSLGSADASLELLRAELQELRRQQEESQRLQQAEAERQRQQQTADFQELVSQQVAKELERQGGAGRRSSTGRQKVNPEISVSNIS